MLFTPIPPMLPSWGDGPFDDDEFIFEPKWDGLRLQLHKQGRRIEAYARNGRNATARFPELRQALPAIESEEAIIDCEAICLRDGSAKLDDIMYRWRISQSAKIERAQRTHPATFVALDILHDGMPLLKKPLAERKERLLETVKTTETIMPTLFRKGQGRAMFELTKARDMEGIVAKRLTSLYDPGERSEEWIKIKHVKTMDTVVLGYRTEPFALIVGAHFRTVRNKPVGVVQAGVETEARERILGRAKELHTRKEGDTQWIEPRLVCRIAYGDRTDAHQLMRTAFVQFLPDKRADDCVWNG